MLHPPITYLSGAVRPELADRIGFMHTPMMGNANVPGATWAADNGCFAKPEAFSWDGFTRWLAERPREDCLFATAPDVVGDAAATLAKFWPSLEHLRPTGYPVAFVAQDGSERAGYYTEDLWAAFDVLFIGGSTEWKMSLEVELLIAEAKGRGKRVHVGRVNSYKRLRHFWLAGADSADGTFLAFGPEKNTPRLLSWLDRIEAEHRAGQGRLELAAAA